MDLRNQTTTATTIARGVHSPGMEYVGLYYVPESMKSGLSAHSTASCGYHRVSTPHVRVPVYHGENDKGEEGYYCVSGGGEAKRRVEFCPHCPAEMDDAWMGKALCAGQQDERIFSPHWTQHKSFIAEYCDNCPVVVECFEYAVNYNDIGIWGGVYLPDQHGSRKGDIIEKRRKELGLG